MRVQRSIHGLVAYIMKRSDAAGTQHLRSGINRGAILWAAGVIFISLMANVLFAGTSGFQEYWVPGQESLLRANYVSIDNDPTIGNQMHCVVSVTASADGTIINYDHWENGYGSADETYTLNTGQVKIFESANIPANPRGTSTYYDGGDRITVIGGPVFVARASWPESPGVVMAAAFELLPVQAMATTFDMPVGYDLNQNNRNLPFSDFQHVVLMVQSTADNNTITVRRPDNTVLYSGVVSRGQSVTSTALQTILKGSRVVSTYPVQIQFLTGREVSGTSSQINGYTGIPTSLWSRKYMAPMPSFTASSSSQIDSRTDLYLYNPNSSTITISYRDSTTGSFTVAANTLASFAQKTGHYVPRQYGVYLEGSDIFWGFGESGSGYDTWDWGGILVPLEFCRSEYVMGWAPGSLNGSANHSVAYVMPKRNNTTIWVDYDQNGTADYTTTLNFPQVGRIADPNDFNLTGARIYGTDTLAITYGEVSGTPTPTGSPAIDVGYTVLPLTETFVDQVLTLEKSSGSDTVMVNRAATFSIKVTSHNYPVATINVSDHLPAGWQYVANSTTVTFSNGNPPQSPEPTITGSLAAGYNLAWNLANSLAANQYFIITFSALPTASAALGLNENCAEATGTYNSNTFNPDDCAYIYLKNVASVGDKLWNDLNRDGLQEPDAAGVAGTTIELYQSNGTLVASKITDGTGDFRFDNLVPGDYYLVFIPPTGYAFSPKDQGSDDTIDSDADPSTGRTATFTLSPGEEDLTWDAGIYQLIPAIQIKKYTNDEDADLPTGPSIPVGSQVIWRYEVTNTGDAPLSSIVVTDNQPGITPVYQSGDDGDNILEAGETWIYQASGTAIVGQYSNMGTAAGTFNGQEVTDTDPSHYFGGQAGIQIKKYTNGDDAENPPGPYITPGTTVTWTYVVTNTGNVAVSNIIVTDSEVGVTPAYISGDNGNGLLDVGESWTFSATGTARVGQYSNVGTANGTDTYNQPVTDSDLAHYFGPSPGIGLQKQVNGSDADTPRGVTLPVGQTVTWRYYIRNTGNVPLSNITITDDQGVVPVSVDDSPVDGFNDGDVNKNNLLDPGEIWLFVASGTATAGQYTNIGTATGRYEGQTVTASDPANYYGGVSGISLTKTTNGEDANIAPGPGIVVGSSVTWRYEVRNTGNTPVRDLAVIDDQGVVVLPVDTAPADGYNDGDVNKDHLLDVSEIWYYEGTGVAQLGQYANIGTATGVDDFTGQPVDSSDPSHYFGATPGVSIIKRTNGEDANLPPGPTIVPGASVLWQYVISNTGNVPLDAVNVTDSDPAVRPIYNTGDLNNNNKIDIGESWVYDAVGTAALGQYANTGFVSARYDDATVQDDDPSHYFCEWPRGNIGDKVWNDLDRDGIQQPGAIGVSNVTVELYAADGTLAGSTTTNSLGEYSFVNLVPGDYYLVFLTSVGWAISPMDQGTDDELDSDANLATGRTATFSLSPGQTDNSRDVGLYQQVPAIHIEKSTNGEDADVPTGPSIPVGNTVTWRYAVTNPGDVALNNVTVTDDQAGVSPVYQSGDDGDNLLEPGESWIYQATSTARVGQYANIGTASGSWNGQTVTDTDPSHYFGGQAGIQIKKYINGDDAEEAPGPYITPGSTTTWTYVVTNTGNTAITNVLVTDSEAGVVPVYVNGDNGDGLLNPGESWTYSASGTARAGQYVNIGTVNGSDVLDQPVSDNDLAHYFGPVVGIDLVKYVNGEDANMAPGPAIAVGQPVVWTYSISNTGNVPLGSITMSDDKGVTPLPVDVSPADGFNDGDYNKNNLLDLDEQWNFTASGTATAGQYTNIGTILGSYDGQTVSDTDPANYFGGFAGIDLIKSTNGDDADTPPGPGIVVGQTVTWRYEIRNLGNTPIRDVAVSDDQGVTVVPVDVSPADGFIDGDVDKDNLLDVNEIWIYQATGTAQTGQYTNIGTVTGVDNLTSQQTSDNNPSHYFGATPGINVVKRTNGEDANSAPGPTIIPGGAVTWSYVVTNTGNVPLSNVTVTDSDPAVTPNYSVGDLDNDGLLDTNETWVFNASGTAVIGQYANTGYVSARYDGITVQDDDPSHYFSELPRGSIGDKVWNDLNRDGIQQPSPQGVANVTVELHQADGTLVATTTTNSLGDYQFTDVIPGDYYLVFLRPAGWAISPQDQGTDDALDSDASPATGRTATFTLSPGQSDNSRDAGIYLQQPGIRIEKSTNGEDADVPTGPSIPVGGVVTWRYTVTNPGDVALSNVTVTDDQAGVSPVYQSGDDGDNLLEPGETWIYQASGTAKAGQYTNVGTASGSYSGQTVTDTDPSHYFGGQAGIQIKKYVNGDDADTAPGPIITVGDPVTWTYVVTNTGNTAVSNVLVTDSEAGVTPAYLSGDNGNGLLDVGESWTFSAVGTARAGQYVNVGTVNATDSYGQPVSDSDLAHYFGPALGINLQKLVNSEDANVAPGPAIAVGQPVVWTYYVANTGNVALGNITVSDDQGVMPVPVDASPADGYNDGDVNKNNLLDFNELWAFSASGTSTAGQYTNIGTVSGRYNGQSVSDTDPANYFGGFAGIDLIKSTNGDDADTPPGPGIIAGQPVIWRYAVHNLGNTPIRDVVVSDDQGVTVVPVDVSPADGFIDGDVDKDNLLDVNEIWIYQGTGTAKPGQYANIGSVTGVDNLTSQPTNDADPSHYYGATPGINVVKRTNGEDANSAPGPTLLPGSAITWEYIVTNTGNVALANVTVTDSDPAVTPYYSVGDLDNDGLLDVGETWVFSATGTAVIGQYANTGTASGSYQGTTVHGSDPSHYFSELPRGSIGDKVWDDTNRDGIQEPGAIGIEGVIVELHQADGTLVATTTTNSQGEYYFNNIIPGGYYLVFVRPAGYAATLQNQGTNDELDSDANVVTGRTADFTLAPGETDNSQDAGFYVMVPDIHIEKRTNGDDADVPTGPSIPVGSAVVWRYEVSNPGDVALSNVTVSDDQAGVSPVYQSGDDGDNLLEPGETWIYQASGTAKTGQYANVGTASGSYSGQTVTDTDPSHYFGGQAGIQIKKYVNGDDAEVAPGPSIIPGSTVTWTYVVTNTGNTVVTNVLVTDSEAGVVPVYVSGDNSDGLLNPGESWTYSATGTAQAGQYVNIGTVNGTDALSQQVSDSDLAHYFGPVPGIDVEKYINGQDADVPTGPAVIVGQPVNWRYVITNTGNVPLGNITVTDDQGLTPVSADLSPADGFNDGDLNHNNLLDVNEQWFFTATGVATAGQYTNIGTVSGRYNGQSVSDTDPANYYGGQVGIGIVKFTNGEDANNTPGPGIIAGSVVTWRYEIRNLGNTPIRDVAVSDDQGVSVTAVDVAPADGFNDGDLDKDNLLDVNETWIFQATGSAKPGQYTNIGTVTGTDNLTGLPTRNSDISHYFGATPAIQIVKRTNGEDADLPPGPTVTPGTTVIWQYVVSNAGNVALSNIKLTDSDPAVTPIYVIGDLNNNGLLDVGESWIFEASGVAVGGQYSNTGTATGNYAGVTYEDSNPSHYMAYADFDYGDLPDPTYPTLLASNGARHVLSPLYLGSKIDAEPDGLTSPNASGDDSDGLDDEDGVNFPNLPLVQGTPNTVNVVSSGSGYLNAWIDFNNDGDFNDNGEHIITNYAVIAGNNTISFMVPMIAPGAPPQLLNLNSRFRLASQRGLGVTGLALDGEVEDYQVTTYVPVELSSFSAHVENGRVELSWTTQSESENLGFLIFRSETEEGQYERITTQLISGAGNSSQEHDYSFVDAQVIDGKDYYYKLADVQFDGTMRYHQTIKVTVTTPVEYSLEQNYPNPFNPTTTISFRVKEAGQVELAIFNVKGELVRKLVSENKNAGFYSVEWDARDKAGATVPSGTYIYQLSVNGFRINKQMTLLK